MWLLRRIFSKLLRDQQVRSQQSAPRAPAEQSSAVTRKLVRDPICGMHVDETLSTHSGMKANWFIFARLRAGTRM